jgi:hypothetical protein
MSLRLTVCCEQKVTAAHIFGADGAGSRARQALKVRQYR